MIYKYMDNLEKFWNDLADCCPTQPVEDTTVLGIPLEEPKGKSTNADELAKALERVSALEKQIAELTEQKDGIHIES